MSANAQKSNAKLSEVEDSPKVRLALVRAPLELFSKTHPSKAARIRRDLRDSVGQWFAEARLPYFDYLHVLARVGSDDEDGNLLLRAGMAPDLGTLGLFGKACIHSDTLWTALKTAQRLMDGLVSAGKINIRLQRNRCRVSVSTALLIPDGFDESSKYLISLLCYRVA